MCALRRSDRCRAVMPNSTSPTTGITLTPIRRRARQRVAGRMTPTSIDPGDVISIGGATARRPSHRAAAASRRSSVRAGMARSSSVARRTVNRWSPIAARVTIGPIPERHDPRRLQLLSIAGPLLAGFVLFAFMRRVEFLALTLLSPVLLLATMLDERRAGRRSSRREIAAFRSMLADRQQRARRRCVPPSGRNGSRPRPTLPIWCDAPNRPRSTCGARGGDAEDFLRLRIGTGRRDARSTSCSRRAASSGSVTRRRRPSIGATTDRRRSDHSRSRRAGVGDPRDAAAGRWRRHRARRASGVPALPTICSMVAAVAADCGDVRVDEVAAAHACRSAVRVRRLARTRSTPSGLIRDAARRSPASACSPRCRTRHMSWRSSTRDRSATAARSAVSSTVAPAADRRGVDRGRRRLTCRIVRGRCSRSARRAGSGRRRPRVDADRRRRRTGVARRRRTSGAERLAPVRDVDSDERAGIAADVALRRRARSRRDSSRDRRRDGGSAWRARAARPDRHRRRGTGRDRPRRGRPAHADRRHDRVGQERVAAVGGARRSPPATRRSGSTSCSSTTRAARPRRCSSTCRTPLATSPTSTPPRRGARSCRCGPSSSAAWRCSRDAPRTSAELLAVAPDDAPPALVIVIDEFATLAKQLPEFVAGRGRHRPARPQPRNPPRAVDAASRRVPSTRTSSPTPTSASRSACSTVPIRPPMVGSAAAAEIPVAIARPRRRAASDRSASVRVSERIRRTRVVDRRRSDARDRDRRLR